jgi:hypothetical protein
MKGYNTLKEYIQDYRLFLAAKRADPGRDSGMTLTNFFKKRIENKLQKATVKFKSMMKKNHYNEEELRIIATHEVIGSIDSIQDFVFICFGSGHQISLYKKVLSTNAFRNGQLRKIYDFIPNSISTKDEFIELLRSNRGWNRSELNIVMHYICKANWRVWLADLEQDNKIVLRKGRIQNVF